MSLPIALDIERHKVGRQAVVHERPAFRRQPILVETILLEGYRVKCIVINIHTAHGEVGYVEIALAIDKGAG